MQVSILSAISTFLLLAFTLVSVFIQSWVMLVGINVMWIGVLVLSERKRKHKK